jgi:hypothetical protein
MVKKGLLMLVLAAVAVGGVFAQTGFASMPKNTITVDVGPTILGLAFGQAGTIIENMAGDTEMPDLDFSGLGIAAQYERQLLSQLSVAARVAYMGVGIDYNEDFSNTEYSGNESLGLDLTTLSAEGHFRFYPFGQTFFLGAMAGYGNLVIGASGEAVGTHNVTGVTEREPIVSFTAQRNYVKVGARLGWRIDFGRPGGFVFEPSFGYDHAFGLGESPFAKKLQDGIGGDLGDIDAIGDLDDAFKILENYVFVGGPRLTLSFGWRF